MSSIKIRQTLLIDIPHIVNIDIAANSEHPVMALPWKHPSHRYEVLFSRYLYFFNCKKSQFFVAIESSVSKLGVDEEKVVGFLVGLAPKSRHNEDSDKEDEWIPELPEGTDVKFVMHYLTGVEKGKMEVKMDDMWELEVLAVSRDHQRKGIGSILMDGWLKTVNEDGRALYILSSKMGKGLYEKFGCTERAVLETDLREWDVGEPYINFQMVRDGKKSN